MNRIAVLLTGLGAVLVVALFYVVVFQPAQDEVAELEEQIAVQEEQQRLLVAEIERLRNVRVDAPGVEAELAAAEAIIPRDAALPLTLRQLQTAADESGLVLSSVSTARPTEVADAPEDGSSGIAINLQVSGTYFQVIDFLRRVEDPSITSRAVLWRTATVGRGADYPELNVSLGGTAFAVIGDPVVPEPEPVEEAPVDDDEAEEDGS